MATAKFTPAPNYKALTAAQRLELWSAQREAVIVHQDGFCARPHSGSRLDNRAWDDLKRAERESAFIHRVARACGDEWAAR